MRRYNFNRKKLFDGCLLASIAHAIMMLKFPELSYEHSWDGMNYSMNDGCGCKATITFASNITIAAFQSIECTSVPYKSYLPDNKMVIQVAETETLQYLLENFDGKIHPVITELFWGVNDDLYGIDSLSTAFKKGAFLIQNHLLPIDESLNCWQEYYEMTQDECLLVKEIFLLREKREYLILNEIHSNKIKELANRYSENGLKECIISLKEINILIS